MTAFLGMYDRAETAAANDRFWAAIRARLGYGPETLTRADDPWPIWRDPKLVLAQTCGLPYRAKLHDNVQLVGTPDYGIADCAPGFYYSALVARTDDPRSSLTDFDGARFAYNEALSQSGWAAPMAQFSKESVQPGSLLQTGAHRASAKAVADGKADLAALDALSWQMMQRWDAFAADLHIVARTPPTPGLPYITAPDQDATTIAAAVQGAIDDLAENDRETLCLHGLVQIPKARYLQEPLPPTP